MKTEIAYKIITSELSIAPSLFQHCIEIAIPSLHIVVHSSISIANGIGIATNGIVS